MGLFKKKRQYIPIASKQPLDTHLPKPSVPNDMWVQCESCRKAIYVKSITAHHLCPHCDFAFKLGAKDRLNLICDAETFEELDSTIMGQDKLNFPGYQEKICGEQVKTGLTEAVVTGRAKINAQPVMIGVMDSHFMMGSMGQAVGEKITRLFEYATENRLPVVIFTASGGARMQEGIISLMQMAKITNAVKRHSNHGLFYLTVLTDPTMGGVTASFAMDGDIILAEPNARIGFAGARVIEQTIQQKLPDDFQRAEFLLDHGFIDKIVPREELKNTIGTFLQFHSQYEEGTDG